jgi:hypothetical protein
MRFYVECNILLIALWSNVVVSHQLLSTGMWQNHSAWEHMGAKFSWGCLALCSFPHARFALHVFANCLLCPSGVEVRHVLRRLQTAVCLLLNLRLQGASVGYLGSCYGFACYTIFYAYYLKGAKLDLWAVVTRNAKHLLTKGRAQSLAMKEIVRSQNIAQLYWTQHSYRLLDI